VFEQKRGDTPAVHVVGHGESDLGGTGLSWLITGHPDQPVAEPGE
jgi:hypothetical protein